MPRLCCRPVRNAPAIRDAAVPGDVTGPTARRVQRHTLIVLSLTQIIGAVGSGVVPSVGVLLAEQVTESPVWAGLARTGSTLGAAAAGLPLAALAVRHGRRWSLGTGWTVAAAGTALLVLAAQMSNLILLIVGLFITGVGSAAQLQARFAATDLAAPAGKGRALSTVVWVGAIGSVLGPNLGGPGQWLARLLGLTDMAGAFLLAVGFLLASGIVTALWLRPDPLLYATRLATASPSPSPSPVPGTGHRRRAGLGEIAAICRTDRAALLALVAIITAQAVMVTVMTMAPVQMSHHGGSLTVVGLSISLHILGMYGLAPVSGLVCDRFGAPAGILIGIVLFLASSTLTLVDDADLTAVAVTLVLLGLGWSFMSVAGSAGLSRAVTDHSRARVQGLADTASNAAAAIGAFIGGPLMAVAGYDGLGVLAAAALIPVGVILVRSRRER